MCPHISHPPKWRKSSKKVPPMLGKKNNFLGRGANAYSCPLPPPPAMVGGKSRPSTPPWKTIEGLSATFSPRGGGGAFLPCEGFFATFSSYGGPFSPCGGLFHHVGAFFATFFPLWGAFFTMPFCYFFLCGGLFVTFFSSGMGAFWTMRGPLWLRFSPYGGPFCHFFSMWVIFFLLYGAFFGLPPSIRFGYETIWGRPCPPPPIRLRAPKPSLHPMRAPKSRHTPPAGARHTLPPMGAHAYAYIHVSFNINNYKVINCVKYV